MSRIPGRISICVAIAVALLLAAPGPEAAAPPEPRVVAADAGGYHDLRPLRTAAKDDDADRDQPAVGRVLRVGPAREYKMPSEALAAARDGDTIEIDAGEYVGDAVCIRSVHNLTVRGVGGYAHMRAVPAPGKKHPLQCDSANRSVRASDGRATWSFFDVSEVVLEKLEFSGASSDSGNSAGIRISRAKGRFVIRDALFHHNQNGLITDSNKNLSLLVERSQFDHNGGNGYIHNIYVGKIKRFTLRESYSRRAHGGQLVKSRAFENFILYNRLTDEAPVNSNYQLELAGLGKAYVIGNVLRKRDGSTNCCALFHINVDSRREHELYVGNNTFVYESNPGRSNRRFIRILNRRDAPVRATVVNNLFVGENNVDYVAISGDGVQLDQRANLRVAPSEKLFVDKDGYDFRLTSTAMAINGGIDPGSANGMSLRPDTEYVHPVQGRPREISGPAIDIGAYEFTGTPARLYPPPILDMSVAHTLVDASSEITWSTNADSCVAGGAWSDAKATEGTVNTGPISEPTRFTLTCTSKGGEATQTVVATPPPPVELDMGVAFDPAPRDAGSVVYWQAKHALTCEGVEGISGAQPLQGGHSTGPLQAPTSYALSCLGLDGKSRRSATVTVKLANTPLGLPANLTETFRLKADAQELGTSLQDGQKVTPTRGPAGSLRLVGSGKAVIERVQGGHGIRFSYGRGGGQQNKHTAYLEFPLSAVEARNLFSEEGGEINAHIEPRFSYEGRARAFPRGNNGHQIGQIVDVMTDKGDHVAELAFETWNGGKMHLYYSVPGGKRETLILGPAVSSALLTKGRPLHIRLVWDGSTAVILLNDALAQQVAYKRTPVDWGSSASMTIGAGNHRKYGPGWTVLHDALVDLRVSTAVGAE